MPHKKDKGSFRVDVPDDAVAAALRSVDRVARGDAAPASEGQPPGAEGAPAAPAEPGAPQDPELAKLAAQLEL